MCINNLLPSSHVDTFARDRLPPKEQWPLFIFDRPEIQYAEQLNVANELVDRHVIAGNGKLPALHGQSPLGPFTWTYEQLQQQVDRIAHVLVSDMGLVSGNRLLLRGANSPMTAACWLAGIKAGLVLVPTMPLLRSAELQKIIDKAQITAALCAASLADELDHCLDPLHPHNTPSLQKILHFGGTSSSTCLEEKMFRHNADFQACTTSRDDVCLIAFTSGTTGVPKGTMHFHRDILAMCDLFPRHFLEMTSRDIVCGTPPLAFTFGLGGLLTFPLRYGASSILIEKYTPLSLLETISQYRATQCYTAPTFYRQMAQIAPQFDLSCLRHPISAGEALPDATRELWKKSTGQEITDGIGGTEMIHIYIASAGKHVKPGCLGYTVPGYRTQIVDDQMNPLPPGVPGRLAVRGPTGCRYLDDTRQRDYVKNGWNLPGDTFIMDEQGYFRYLARNDDMIVSAGYNIASPEVENALLEHPAIAECGVIGTPDEDRGQIVTAFVVLKEGYVGSTQMEMALQQFVKDNFAPYKYPRKIIFVDQLPRTETGKVQRFKLQQLA
ncbi:AMP-binding protein [Limnohabitans sp. TEGF004]|jgi:2-aminobenzoate-CoA ligase|uniref:AMP-binding protein n=1 Tax=Limnohabitans sp. TEGF004 TaxID=2986281 RepID=UPI0024901231|nr:AMP-binding protein [Limnohabitans sp. TEGF004]